MRISKTKRKPRTRPERVFTARIAAIIPSHIEWANPLAITELTARGVRVLTACLRDEDAEYLTIHRQFCDRTRHDDATFECTCVPLCLMLGAEA